MKKIGAALSGLLVIMLLCNSCSKTTGEGPLVTETRDIKDFSGIDMGISGVLRLIPDDAYKVEIQAQHNILQVIETVVINGELKVRFKKNTRLRSHKPIQVVIHAPAISSMAISGSADAFIERPLMTDHLQLSIAGSGNIHTDTLLAATHCNITVAGSGNISISYLKSKTLKSAINGSGSMLVKDGETTDETIDIRGSGNVDLSAVSAQTAAINSSGSGNIRINVSQRLDVSLSGSGNVYYKGNPTININISGSGKVIPL